MPEQVNTKTSDTLARLRELEGQATKGPWRCTGSTTDIVTGVHQMVQAEGEIPALCWETSDATFIAEIRNSAAALIEVCEAARAVVEYECRERGIGSPKPGFSRAATLTDWNAHELAALAAALNQLDRGAGGAE